MKMTDAQEGLSRLLPKKADEQDWSWKSPKAKGSNGHRPRDSHPYRISRSFMNDICLDSRPRMLRKYDEDPCSRMLTKTVRFSLKTKNASVMKKDLKNNVSEDHVDKKENSQLGVTFKRWRHVVLHICAKVQFNSSAVIAELPEFFVHRLKTSYVNYPHGKREDFVGLFYVRRITRTIDVSTSLRGDNGDCHSRFRLTIWVTGQILIILIEVRWWRSGQDRVKAKITGEDRFAEDCFGDMAKITEYH